MKTDADTSQMTREQIQDAYKRLSDSEAFDVVIADLRRYCQLDQPAFVPGQTESLVFQEGARSVFWWIQSQVDAKPGQTEAEE